MTSHSDLRDYYAVVGDLSDIYVWRMMTSMTSKILILNRAVGLNLYSVGKMEKSEKGVHHVTVGGGSD